MSINPKVKKYGLIGGAIVIGAIVIYYVYQQMQASNAANAASAANAANLAAQQAAAYAAGYSPYAASSGTAATQASTPGLTVTIPTLATTPAASTTTPTASTGNSNAIILSGPQSNPAQAVIQQAQSQLISAPSSPYSDPTGAVNVTPEVYNSVQASQADYIAPPEQGVVVSNTLGTSTFQTLSSYLDTELQSAEATGSTESITQFQAGLTADAASQCAILGSNDPNCGNEQSVVSSLAASYAAHVAAMNTPQPVYNLPTAANNTSLTAAQATANELAPMGQGGNPGTTLLTGNATSNAIIKSGPTPALANTGPRAGLLARLA